MAKDNRTERPTAKVIRKAREKGNVARSADVSHAVSLMVFLLWAWFAGGAFLDAMRGVVRDGMTVVTQTDDPGRLIRLGEASFLRGMQILAPLLLPLMVFGIAGSVMQTGYHPRRPMIKLELNKLNPLSGLRRFISIDKIIAAVKALARAALYASIAAAVVLPEWKNVTGMTAMTPAGIWAATADIVRRILVRVLLVGIVLAVIDFSVTRYRWYRGLYMTKQEVRDEHKENENPELKARVRGKQREIARRRMMSAVRTADVVVTNPTHVAVALKYDRAKMVAPVVVAKGRGYVALRIRELAKAAGVPIVEDPPLARMLEKLCALGAPVPEALYRAVAEVFAYVFRRRHGPYRVHAEVESTAEATAAGVVDVGAGHDDGVRA